jgi:thiol-disulfide isomerase/thioredoxin
MARALLCSLFASLLSLLAVSASKSGGALVRYHDDDFDRLAQATLSRGGGIFLFLSAPWCGHCKRLTPTWKKLAAEVAERNARVLGARGGSGDDEGDDDADGNGIGIGGAQSLAGTTVIAKVDATRHRFVSSRFDVVGYPTLVYIRPDGQVVRYKHRWEIEPLLNFATGGHADPSMEYEDRGACGVGGGGVFFFFFFFFFFFLPACV